MEKLKDILHDFSDVLLAVLIVFIMFSVVALNLGDWFDNSNVVAVDYNPPIDNTIEDETLPNIEENEIATDVETEKEEEEVEEEVEDEVDSQENTSVDIVVVDHIQITIPNGTPGVGIANILLDNQLIENASDFIKASEDLNLSLQLKSGNFDIPVGSTVEEIVKIIARYN